MEGQNWAKKRTAREKRAMMVSSVCVGVIAWAMRAVCGWDSLDCCSRVIVYGCVGVGVGVSVGVWVIVWV